MGMLTTDHEDSHVSKDAPNRWENPCHHSFHIRFHPWNPWFHFGFRDQSM